MLLHGSETGQSQAIAEEIHELAPKHHLHSDINCLSLTEKRFSLAKETCMVLVVSTTGEGECPEKAMKFWRRLRKTTLPPDHLAHLNYALLALGDSNYSHFCRNGKNFDERLQELGAKKMYPTGYADDAVGLEVVVEPWIEGLWKELHRILDKENPEDLSLHLQNGCSEMISEERDQEKISRTNGDTSSNHTIDTSATQNGIGSEDLVNSALREKINTLQLVAKKSAIAENGAVHSESESGLGVSSRVSESNSSSEDSTTTSAENARTDPQTGKGSSVAEKVEGPRVPSVNFSVPPLSESGLTLPVLPPPYLKVEYAPNETIDLNSLPVQGGASLPSSSSDVILASVVTATQLTTDDAVKTALDVELRVSDGCMGFQPGDSFSVICANEAEEVLVLLQRLGVSEMADVPVRVSVIEGTKKKRATLPEFMTSLSTLRHLFTTCCDIRALPKKAFLRTLVEYTSDIDEERRLQELCSKQGQADYAAYLRGPGLSLLDILTAFPSCNPPIERILEHVTRLQPRPYSISSSPHTNSNSFHFVFNVIDIPAGDGRSQSRQGVCTGWLNRLAKTSGRGQDSYQLSIKDVGEKIDKLSPDESSLEVKIPIYSRTNQHFHLPSDPSKPLILIGPGTGVAPFIGFLEHRGHMMQQAANDASEGSSMTFGPVWLFFGCRHKERDFLYREKLEGFQETGVLSHLCVSFSRDQQPDNNGSSEQAPRYVQDQMKRHRAELATLVLEKDAHVYVCGDAKNMAKNVLETWKEIFKEKTGLGDYDMLQLIAKLREEKRYLEDVWT